MFLEQTIKHFVHCSVRNHYKRTSLSNSESGDPSRTVTPTLQKTLRSVLYKLCDTSYLEHYSFAQRLGWVWLTFLDAKIIALKLHTRHGSYPTVETKRYLHSARWGGITIPHSLLRTTSEGDLVTSFSPKLRCTNKYTLQVALTICSQQ